MIADPYKQF
jgi:hypothetical protein